MNVEPKIGEVVTWDYGRYKCVKTNDGQLARECQTFCALGNPQLRQTLCGVVHCTPLNRADKEFVHFVKMAPRKKRHTL